ncbi:MAG: histidinol-phosphate aminotransferase [Bermanella sp.]|jgi:histidinol-phosphate aminotransferase|uniref:histidinol-phosphate transaminase n=1 Tax=Glaciecola sp. 33A TaxID=2057807 RepID=UPI000C34005E|nr:histidinol-phosphate transaminase [Glaciecola sp. 33A]PKI01845.1 histidinol-phosphate transaminase [Glaciecola sp. 33A]
MNTKQKNRGNEINTTANWLLDLSLEHVNKLTPYESARRLFAGSGTDTGHVWLNANESPFAGEYTVDSSVFNRYPDCQPDTVIKGYTKYTNLQAAQTLVTRGADEGIELIIRAFCEPRKDSILICPPTYGMYAISAQTFNVGVQKSVLNDDFTLNIADILTYVGKVKAVFICSPNNPTGTSVSRQDIVTVLEAFKDKAIVVVDEAYIEFDITQNQTDLLEQYENLVILRTLSKAFALAGLRCGFTLASAAIVQILLKVIAPYPIPAPVAQVASKALESDGLLKMRRDVDLLKTELIALREVLTDIGDIQIVGNINANFVLFRTQRKTELMAFLVKNKMLIRDQSKQINLNNCLRISIGTPEQNNTLLSLIKAFFADGNQ